MIHDSDDFQNFLQKLTKVISMVELREKWSSHSDKSFDPFWSHTLIKASQNGIYLLRLKVGKVNMFVRIELVKWDYLTGT